MNLEEYEMSMCLSIKSSFIEIIFLCACSRIDLTGKNSFFSEQTTADSSLLVSGEKRGKVRSKSALRLKRLRSLMRLIKEFFDVEALNLIVEPKSQPGLTMGHICQLRRKESLVPCGFKMRIAL